MRQTVNAIFYLTRSGCAWRYLPRDYPPWPTVYGYFRAWRLDGTWERIHDRLRARVRAPGRARLATLGGDPRQPDGQDHGPRRERSAASTPAS